MASSFFMQLSLFSKTFKMSISGTVFSVLLEQSYMAPDAFATFKVSSPMLLIFPVSSKSAKSSKFKYLEIALAARSLPSRSDFSIYCLMMSSSGILPASNAYFRFTILSRF